MDDFLSFVADVMGVDVSDITPDIEYKEFEKWDSLMMLTLIMEMEAEYGISIPMESVGHVKTLSDMYEFVKQI